MTNRIMKARWSELIKRREKDIRESEKRERRVRRIMKNVQYTKSGSDISNARNCYTEEERIGANEDPVIGNLRKEVISQGNIVSFKLGEEHNYATENCVTDGAAKHVLEMMLQSRLTMKQYMQLCDAPPSRFAEAMWHICEEDLK